MKYNYQSRSKTGEIQSGVVEASSKEAAFEVLKKNGLFVTALEKENLPFYARKLKIFERVSQKDVVGFSRQFSIMLKSKIPLTETLRTLATQTRNNAFKEVLLGISKDVEGGSSLSKGFGGFPKVFSVFFVSMVKSGERSGKLSGIFIYLAAYLEKRYHFRNEIIGAMVYPAFVLLVFGAVVIVLMTYVIPELTKVLITTNQDIPWITQIVMASSDFLVHHGIIVFLFLVFFIVFLVRYTKSEKGKRFFSKYLLKLPMIGPFLTKFYLSQLALNLSTLISGGLQISESLAITANIISNYEYKKIIKETRDDVEKGSTISAVLKRYPELVSPFFFQMVAVGEKTGTLDSSLKNVVSFYDEDIDRDLKNFVKILEPLFIVLLGVVVGGLVASVLLPIYSMKIV
ncbi:MAG: type II secretion system F family protein [Patescibacteria group bacterium]|nr:type II secretion system F family protein [Patescibacteria group bacterium]